MLAKKKRNLSTVEKITRVVAVLMLIGTLGAIVLQVALTILNYKWKKVRQVMKCTPKVRHKI